MKSFEGQFLAGKVDENPCRALPAARVRRRAPEEYPRLVDQLEGPLTKFVSRYVRDRHAAEDLVQESFLRAFRNLHRYRGQSSLKSWIYSIARNLCLDHLKASGRSRLRLLENFESADRDPILRRQDLPDSQRFDPSGRIERDESCARVGRALTGLSKEARDLLILRVYLGLSYRQIARRCKVAPAGVGVRLSRALKALSESLP